VTAALIFPRPADRIDKPGGPVAGPPGWVDYSDFEFDPGEGVSVFEGGVFSSLLLSETGFSLSPLFDELPRGAPEGERLSVE